MHAKLRMSGVISNIVDTFWTSNEFSRAFLSRLGQNRTQNRARKLQDGITHGMHNRNASN